MNKVLLIIGLLASPLLGFAAALGLWWLLMVKAIAPIAAALQSIANAL